MADSKAPSSRAISRAEHLGRVARQVFDEDMYVCPRCFGLNRPIHQTLPHSKQYCCRSRQYSDIKVEDSDTSLYAVAYRKLELLAETPAQSDAVQSMKAQIESDDKDTWHAHTLIVPEAPGNDPRKYTPSLVQKIRCETDMPSTRGVDPPVYFELKDPAAKVSSKQKQFVFKSRRIGKSIFAPAPGKVKPSEAMRNNRLANKGRTFKGGKGLAYPNF